MLARGNEFVGSLRYARRMKGNGRLGVSIDFTGKRGFSVGFNCAVNVN